MASINDYEANLNGLLLGLVDTDKNIIEKLDDLQNQIQNRIQNQIQNQIQDQIDKVNNDIKKEIEKLDDSHNQIQNQIDKVNNDIKKEIDDLEDKVARGSGSYAILDINAPGITGNGALKDDKQASDKKCYSYTSDGTTTQLIYSASFSDVKFGHYALCIRAKTNAIGTNDLIKVEIKNTNEVIKSITFTGNHFGTTSGYSYLYTTFEYDVTHADPKNLIFNLYSLPMSGVTISFDYVYISMIMPAVFI